MGRALLIGGSGFIGAHLARELLDRGHAVTVLGDDRTYLPGTEHAAARTLAWRRQALLTGAVLRRGGPDDPARLRLDIADAAPDAVVHLANLPLPAVARADPVAARRSIVAGTSAVIGAVAAGAPHARLVYVSSSMVYGDFAAEPQPERGPLRPRDVYGRAKLAAERRVRASGLDWAIVRPASVYGPGDVNGRFLQRLVEAAAHDRPLELTSDPGTRLDFTWVEDLAAGLASAATLADASRGTFNVTAGRARSLGEAIEIVRDLGHDVDVRRRDAPAAHPRRGTLDIAHARAVLGYRPSRSLEDGLQEYLAAVASERLAA